jgi:hypothetical protein
LPTEDEINIHNSLDEQCASKHFLGKTLDEAEALFVENSLYYAGDLMWMGAKAFAFYIPAYLPHIAGSDDVHSFAGLLEFRLEYERESIVAVVGILLRKCEEIVRRWEDFDVRPEIYGDLAGRYAVLANRLKEIQQDG